MADVQTENGYTKIANELLDALSKTPMPGKTMIVYLTIIRKTYGYGKPKDTISLSQFSIATGLSKSDVCRSLKRLLKMTMIGKFAKGNSVTYWIIKDFDRWTPLAKKTTIVKNYNPSLANLPTTIENTTKENSPSIRREGVGKAKQPPKLPSEPTLIVKYFCDKWKETFQAKYPFQQKDGVLLNKLLREYGLDHSKQLIDQYFQDDDPFLISKAYPATWLLSRLPKYLAQPKDQFDDDFYSTH